MKTSKLTTALLFAFYLATSQAAVHISSNNKGQAIIVPFYSVSKKVNTLLSLNNTTYENKAVKIHFKEAKKGATLTTFNVYLAKNDTWTMVTGQQNNKIKMLTNDLSCTLGFPHDQEIDIDDDWLWQNGTIEIIEMGTVEDIDTLERPDSISYQAPYASDCDQLSSFWQNEQMWSNDSSDQLTAASGGLHAEVTVMEIEKGHAAHIPLIHLENFYEPGTIFHTPAGHSEPNLSSGSKLSVEIVDGQPLSTLWEHGFQAVSALLMKSSTTTEFNLETSVAAQTEWILSFPTWHYHMESAHLEPFRLSPLDPKDDEFVFQYLLDGRFIFSDRDNGNYPFHDCGGACDPVHPLAPSILLDHSVSNFIIDKSSNSTTTSILSEDMQANKYLFPAHFQNPVKNPLHDNDINNGKVTFNFYGFPRIMSGVNHTNNSITHKYEGIPVIAFSYTTFSNANAQPGLLAQYAFVREHFGEKKVVIGEAQ